MDTSKLKGLVPDPVLGQIQFVIDTFKINTPLRMCHFLAQCAHESGGFSTAQENLNYSAQRLHEVFPKYFPTVESANVYNRNPAKIANRVYGNRMGNGNEGTGDGFAFRGRGYIQLTGRNNYALFDKYVPEDIIASPDLVAIKYPLLSAGWYFNSRNINSVSDLGATPEVVTKVTKLINGGTHGLDDRLKRFNTFYRALEL